MNADGCSSNGRWQGVFLDFYGTIASGDVQAVEGVCRQVIEDYGLAITAEKMAGLWGHRFFAAIEALGENRFKSLKQIEAETLIQTVLPLTGPIRVEKYIHSFNDFLARPTLYDEVRHVLESLTVPTCIVSNADDEELRAAIEHHGLRFDFVISSETARSYKPDRGIFDTAIKTTGWRSDRVVHVGDSLHSDVGGALRAGLRTAWVNRTVRISDIGTDRPDYTWTDLRPLVDLTSCR
jgi:2-haloacid dehalogenase/putative hydrolase of the HAD superfamily